MMLRLSAEVRIYVASQAIDFRKAINGLLVLISEQYETSVQDGSVYLFYNCDLDRVKCLFWERNGCVLYQKRLERGRFKLGKPETRSHYPISQQQLDWLLAGLDFQLMAAVINAKFRCHMPLYRQEEMFDAAGISVTRGTLSNWVIKAADLLTLLVKLMASDIQHDDVAYADETSLQVLKEKERLPQQKSFMWLFIGGPPEKRAFVYQYHTTRAHQVPADFFADMRRLPNLIFPEKSGVN